MCCQGDRREISSETPGSRRDARIERRDNRPLKHGRKGGTKVNAVTPKREGKMLNDENQYRAKEGQYEEKNWAVEGMREENGLMRGCGKRMG